MGVSSECMIVESKAMRAQAAEEWGGMLGKESVVRINQSTSVL